MNKQSLLYLTIVEGFTDTENLILIKEIKDIKK